MFLRGENGTNRTDVRYIHFAREMGNLPLPLVFFAKFSYPRWNLEEERSVIIDPHLTGKFANAGFLLIN